MQGWPASICTMYTIITLRTTTAAAWLISHRSTTTTSWPPSLLPGTWLTGEFRPITGSQGKAWHFMGTSPFSTYEGKTLHTCNWLHDISTCHIQVYITCLEENFAHKISLPDFVPQQLHQLVWCFRDNLKRNFRDFKASHWSMSQQVVMWLLRASCPGGPRLYPGRWGVRTSCKEEACVGTPCWLADVGFAYTKFDKK